MKHQDHGAAPAARTFTRSLSRNASRGLAVSAIAALLAGLGTALAQAPGAAQAPMASPLPTPPVAVPAPSMRFDSVETICLIEPSLEVNVGTPVDGVIQSIHADRGDVVAPGQVLARMVAGVELAAVELQTAKAEFGARKRARNEELQRKNLISQQELDELTTEQRLAELELKEREEQLKLRAVQSPIHGVVVDRYRNSGDIVRQEKIFRLVQLDPLFVETVVPGSRFGRVRNGQTFNVTLQHMSGKLEAKVVAVDRVIDAASGTFRVRLSLPNPGMRIPPGQRCRVNFATPIGG